jgi:hypothetical protein
MRPNRKEPESAPFWFQSLLFHGRPHGGLLHTCLLRSYNDSEVTFGFRC